MPSNYTLTEIQETLPTLLCTNNQYLNIGTYRQWSEAKSSAHLELIIQIQAPNGHIFYTYY
jgi:hypothetical protein